MRDIAVTIYRDKALNKLEALDPVHKTYAGPDGQVTW